IGQSVRRKMKTTGFPAAISNGSTALPVRSITATDFEALETDAPPSIGAGKGITGLATVCSGVTTSMAATSPANRFNTLSSPNDLLGHFADVHRVRWQRNSR